jgi:DNA repair protein SbcD/Mre11
LKVAGDISPAMLRVAHCSDIHLDGDHASGDHYRHGFLAVLAAARRHAPQLLILAGDLFDSNHACAGTIEWAMQTLAAQPYPVVMIPGNHDCMEPGAIYSRHDFDALPNVEMLTAPDGEIRLLSSLGVAIWGKGMVDHCAAYRPIGDIAPRPDKVKWYLGLGHGIYVPSGENTDRSSPVHAHEIANSPCDYLALGHHHACLEVHAGETAAAYCGSPTDTLGKGATYAVIDLVENAPAVVEICVMDA